MSTVKPNPSNPPNWLLRRLDQAVVAGLVAFGALAAGGYWAYQGGLRGRMIEIDHADPISIAFQVDVNRADVAELMALPEIGPALAQRIADERQANGPFTSLEEVERRVKGIGPKTLEKLRPFLQPVEKSGGLTAKQ